VWLTYACSELGLGMAIRVWVSSTHQVADSMVMGTGMIFYLWVGPVPDPTRAKAGMGIFLHPRVTHWVSKIKLCFYLWPNPIAHHSL
jgi:hypothetical protein